LELPEARVLAFCKHQTDCICYCCYAPFSFCLIKKKQKIKKDRMLQQDVLLAAMRPFNFSVQSGYFTTLFRIGHPMLLRLL
jgi:hypothetical protein